MSITANRTLVWLCAFAAFLLGAIVALLFSRWVVDDWSEVTRWFDAQSPRWATVTTDGVHLDHNVYDIVVNDELRQKIAPRLRAMFPGIGSCRHCGWPWPLVREHTLEYRNGHGRFLFCEDCWQHLKEYGRDEEIRAAYHADLGGATHEEIDAAMDKALEPSMVIRVMPGKYDDVKTIELPAGVTTSWSVEFSPDVELTPP